MTRTNLFDSDRPMTMLGVPGRLTHRTTQPGGEGGELWTRQRWISETRPAGAEWGDRATIRAEVRFDDECRNGHNTFAITGEIRTPGRRDVDACGCLHEDIARAFPELAPLIRFHLVSTDGPMHYVANTLYHASDRDHSGRAAGEPTRFEWGVRFAGVPALHPLKGEAFRKWLASLAEYDREGVAAALVPIAVAGDRSASGYQFAPKWQFAGQPPLKWHECPFDSEGEAERFAASWLNHSPELVSVPVAFSEGKQRDLDAARAVGLWPDATDAELCAPRDELKAALEARLPALIAEFRAAMDSAGLAWSPRAFTPAPAE